MPSQMWILHVMNIFARNLQNIVLSATYIFVIIIYLRIGLHGSKYDICWFGFFVPFMFRRGPIEHDIA